MRIILYGEAQIEGTGAWCYAKNIKEYGHELLLYRNDAELQMYNNSVLWKIARRLNKREVLPKHQKKHFEGLLELAKAQKPDIVIILKGIHIGKDDVKELKMYSSFVVNINHDDFFSHNKNNRSSRQFEAIPEYDYIFTTREVNVEELKPYNKRTEFFMFAYDPDIHFKPLLTHEEQKKYAADVLFIGTYEKPRAAMLEKLTVICDFNLAIYGNDWHKLDKSSVLHKYVRSYTGIWMKEMAKAIAGANITLGFLRKENRDEYTQRTFEVPASGGLFLAERSRFHKSVYEEDKEVVFFDADNMQELKKKIEFLLNNKSIADEIRLAGYNKVINGQFSYQDRITQLVERYNEFHR
jgi:hypothetical protein